MRRATLYVDCRCLQDPAFQQRGVGRHAAALLCTRSGSSYRDLPMIGLIDPALPPLLPEVSTLLDKVTVAVNPTFGPPAIFLDLSPMTHNSRLMSRFIGHPTLFKASVVYDFIPYDWPGYLTSVRERIEYLSNLALLKTASRFFPISRYSA